MPESEVLSQPSLNAVNEPLKDVKTESREDGRVRKAVGTARRLLAPVTTHYLDTMRELGEKPNPGRAITAAGLDLLVNAAIIIPGGGIALNGEYRNVSPVLADRLRLLSGKGIYPYLRRAEQPSR
jgi:hypothetical protein